MWRELDCRMQTSLEFPKQHERVRRAAEYVRMSTEHQQYSTENQADRFREYAERNNIEIVTTYADEGKSGLNIGGRSGLQKLLADVKSGNIGFELILVYDVSRWGRFQDADESAHYVAAGVMLRPSWESPAPPSSNGN